MKNLQSDLSVLVAQASHELAHLNNPDGAGRPNLADLCGVMKEFLEIWGGQHCPVTGEETQEMVDIGGVSMGKETAMRYLQGDARIVESVDRYRSTELDDDMGTASVEDDSEERALQAAMESPEAEAYQTEEREYGTLGPQQQAQQQPQQQPRRRRRRRRRPSAPPADDSEERPQAPRREEVVVASAPPEDETVYEEGLVPYDTGYNDPPPPARRLSPGEMHDEPIESMVHSITGWHPQECGQLVQVFSHNFNDLMNHLQDPQWTHKVPMRVRIRYPELITNGAQNEPGQLLQYMQEYMADAVSQAVADEALAARMQEAQMDNALQTLTVLFRNRQENLH